MNYSVETKSQLAKLLATENIKIEHRNAPTAAFDLKNRTLICPIWKDMSGDMYDLLLGHEVSHALETPEEGWHNAVCDKGANYRHFLNVVEDARIEKKIKRRYPGIRRSFINAYKQLLEEDFFGIKDQNIDKMFFIDRLNVYTKAGISANMKFLNDEENRLLKLVESVETWQDVLDVTEQIWKYSKEEQQQEAPLTYQTAHIVFDDEDEDSETPDGQQKSVYIEYDEDELEDSESDSENSDGENAEETSEDTDETSDEEGASKTQSKQDEEGEAENESNSNQATQNPDQDDTNQETFGDPKCLSDEKFRQNEHKLLSQEVTSYTYISIPKLKNTDMIVSHTEINEFMTSHFKTETFDLNKLHNDFKEKNNQYISLLVKEFEMKKAAKAYNRSKLADTGDIDVNKIYKYQLDDQIFRKAVIVPKGKSHGLVLLLDMSGSMSDNMSGSIEQILVLTSFCKKVNIPFSVFGFTSNSKNVDINESFFQQKNTLQFSSYKLIHFMSSKMKSNEFNTAFKNMCGMTKLFDGHHYIPHQLQLGRTPLVESMITLQPLVKDFKKQNNLDIVNMVIVHDGDADSVHRYCSPGEYEKTMSNNYSERHVLRDVEENLDFQIEDDSTSYHGEKIRKTVFKWFSKTTQTKIFGFFITSTSKNQMNSAVSSRYVDPEEPNKQFSTYFDKYAYYEEKTNKLKKEKWLVSKTPGYESFFLIVGGKNLNIENDELVVTGNVNKKSLTTALRRLTKNRVNNRVLVSKFIEGIAI